MLKEIGALSKELSRRVDKVKATHLIKKKIAAHAKLVKEENRIKKINWKLYRIYN